MARTLLQWSPRVLGVVVSVSVGAFSLDALRDGTFAVLMHAVPALLLLLAVAASWRREWVGGVVFCALALLYAAMAWRRLDWVAVVSGPLLVVGVLFLWNWRHRVQVEAPAA